MASPLTDRVPENVQQRVRTFFELYDPQRLDSSDFNVLLRYIANRGLPALEEKLFKKYGANITSMEKENQHSSQRMSKKEMEDFNSKFNFDAAMSPGDSRPPLAKQDSNRALSELSGLPPPPPPPSDGVSDNNDHDPAYLEDAFAPSYAQPVGGSVRNGAHPGPAINALSGDPEALARQDLFLRLTEFYRKHNLDKLKSGVGDIVEYTMRNGEEKVNRKLMETYGEDLTSFEQNQIRQRKQTQSMGQKAFLIEEGEMATMKPERKKLRERLVQFFLLLDPQRAELRMDPLLNYAEKFGEAQLNKKLFDKYGHSLETVHEIGEAVPEQVEMVPIPVNNNYSSANSKAPSGIPMSVQRPEHRSVRSSQRYEYSKPEKIREDLGNFTKNKQGHELPEYVHAMLERYYAKYDQRMLEEGGVDTVYNWAVRNGLNKLNKKLREKYGQSLQEFLTVANDLRDELIDFYRQVDRNKLVYGIQPILDWGLRNGRTALNMKLRQKYNMDLEVDNQAYLESASQV